MQVSLLTREYPPEVYGGAGVHVEYLARELRDLVDADRALLRRGPRGREGVPSVGRRARQRCARDDVRRPRDDRRRERRAARPLAHVVREPRRAPREAELLDPARRDDAQPRAAAAVEGGAARRRLPPLVLLRAHRARSCGRDRRRVRRDARRRARPATRRSSPIAFVSSTTASIRRSTRRTRTRMFSRSTESIRRRRT